MRKGALFAAILLAFACGGPKTVARDGYRGVLVYSKEDRFAIAVRGESVRVSGTADGSEIHRIVRPDRHKSWQFRPSTRRIFESTWGSTDEAVPGYPLQPGFDSAANSHGLRESNRGPHTHSSDFCRRRRHAAAAVSVVSEQSIARRRHERDPAYSKHSSRG